jgi:beta-galactosidase
VFLDDERLGTLARDAETTLALPSDGGSGVLTIVVESLGRINYGPLLGEGKGIMAGVLVDRRYLHGWTHHIIPLDAPTTSGAHDAIDGLAVATFDVGEPADAWLAFPAGAKGMVWLNGFLLGRYWSVGPQTTLYAPGPLWREGRNEVRVLDTDGLGDTVEIRDRADFGPTEEFIGS